MGFIPDVLSFNIYFETFRNGDKWIIIHDNPLWITKKTHLYDNVLHN